MLRAGDDLVASDVVRHAFNRYHVQLMTSLIIQRKMDELRSSTSTSRYALLQGYMRVGYSPQYIYYELLKLIRIVKK